MDKSHQKEVEEMLEWVIEQIEKTYDLEREQIVTVIENWCEEHW